MLEGDELLHARFGDARPGLTLLSIENAAVPVTVVSTEVLGQERKPLPLLNEFVVRLTQAGVSRTSDAAALLGIDEPLVESAVADEVSSGNVLYRSGTRSIALTPQGARTFTELEAVQPVQKTIPVPFDRMTWRVCDYAQEDLRLKKDLQAEGAVLLPAARTAKIGAGDVTAASLNALFRGGDGGRFEVLSVRNLRPNQHRYLPVKLLVYGDPDAGEVEVSVVVNDDVSAPHDLALAERGGAAQLGIKIAPSTPRPTLSPELEAQRVAIEPGSSSPVADAGAGESGKSEPSVRGVGVFEHRHLLDQALTSASRRLLLIAPWVKSAVVDTAFIGNLEQRLRRGCTVHIAHGYGDDDSGSDARALERLANLARRYKDRFTLARLQNTHAKILIFDDYWISTSFNWLSFRGDPDRTYRMEEGTLVRIPEYVTAEYERFVQLIAEQRVK